MTIQADTRLTSEFLTDGIATVFNFGFPVFITVDGQKGIEVRYINDLGYDVVDTSEFLVTSNADNSGGTVQFYVAPVAGKRLVVAGKTPVDQQLDITNHSRFNGKSIETNFDKLVAILQEWQSNLDEETRQRIVGDSNVITQTNILYNNWQAWAQANVPDFVQQTFDTELEDYKAQWLAAMNLIASGNVAAIGVISATGENQQQYNDRGGAYWYPKLYGYDLHSRVMLANGDFVRSTIDKNTANPNIDMTGWSVINQSWDNIVDKPTTISGYGITDAVNSADVGAAGGVASLGLDGKIPDSELPLIGQYIGSQAVRAISYNAQTIDENVTIPAGVNASSVGDITISTGFAVTIETGAVWKIL